MKKSVVEYAKNNTAFQNMLPTVSTLFEVFFDALTHSICVAKLTKKIRKKKEWTKICPIEHVKSALIYTSMKELLVYNKEGDSFWDANSWNGQSSPVIANYGVVRDAVKGLAVMAGTWPRQVFMEGGAIRKPFEAILEESGVTDPNSRKSGFGEVCVCCMHMFYGDGMVFIEWWPGIGWLSIERAIQVLLC